MSPTTTGRQVKVRHVMTTVPSTRRLNTPPDEANPVLNDMHCGTLIVLDRHGHPVGVLTDRDLAISIGKDPRHASDVSAREAMSSPVHSCRADEDVSTVLERMADARIRRLPVLGANGLLEGIVSIDDIVLWGVQRNGVARNELLRALRAICAAHERLLSTETLDELIATPPASD